MFSLEQLFLRRSLSRMRHLLHEGDAEGARAEMESFVKRFPRSMVGWSTLLGLVDSGHSTFEEWWDVRCRAARAIPYSVELNGAAIEASHYLYIKIGDPRYLGEARALTDAFEELLGVSVETVLWRASTAALSGDTKGVLERCERAEEMLARDPSPRASLQLGLCLGSVAGHEERGLALAEGAASQLKDPSTYLLLVAVAEGRDAAKARELRAKAVEASKHKVPPEKLDALLDQFRDYVRLERDFLATLR